MKAIAFATVWGLVAFVGVAQDIVARNDASILPDAPSAGLAMSAAAIPVAAMPPAAAMPVEPLAKVTAKYIPAGYRAQPLTTGDKIALSFHDLYTPDSFIGFGLAAGYSHLVNGQPNYGVDRGAFGERLGAAAIRDSSQDLFTGAVFAPLLHEDPRYYVQGDQYGVVHRTLYAITRPIITRGDNGRNRLNGSLLLGYASAAALTDAYYPPSNRNAADTGKTYGASIGGAALGFFFQEFIGDGLRAIHLQKRQEP